MNSQYKDIVISHIKKEYYRLSGLIEELEHSEKLDIYYLEQEIKGLEKAFKRIRKRIKLAKKNKLEGL